MQKIIYSLLIVIVSISTSKSFAQIDSVKRYVVSSAFNKTLLIGFGVNNSWSNYRDLQDSSFYRPSLGMHSKADYFFHKSFGLTFGVGIQQRGMGIYTPDYDQSIGNPDSTGRLRYKCTTVDFPVQLLFRPQREIFKNGRFIGGIGITASYMYKAQRIWKSVDDGFHEPVELTASFKKLDLPVRATLGTDIAVPGGSLFRAQLVGELGFEKLYQESTTGNAVGQNTLFGIDLTFLF